jgi:CBS domain-containing protein
MFTGRGKQLTVFVTETDHYHHQALYMAIIEMLRRQGCSGATVTRGVAGFGASTLIRSSTILRLSLDLPMMITVVDRVERIERIFEPLREMAPEALIIVQDIEVIQSGAPFKEGLPDVRVSEVMRRDVVTVHPESPLTQVVELLLDKDYTAVPVLDHEGKIVGMVSDNDLLTRGGMRVAISLKRATDLDYVRGLHESLENPSRTVAGVMTSEVVTIPPDMLLGRAGRLMVERHVKRLPVVDANGKLVGILGRLDILNTLAAVHLPDWHPGARVFGAQATVGDVMTHEVSTAHESASLEDIFQLLVSSSHKRVVIVDDQRHVVGIVADSDLISRVSRESWSGIIEILVSKVPIERISGPARKHIQKLRARSAKELMTQPVITVQETMPVASALALSAEKRVKRIPVVTAEGQLAGIVGRAEMMRVLLARSAAEGAERSAGCFGWRHRIGSAVFGRRLVCKSLRPCVSVRNVRDQRYG